MYVLGTYIIYHGKMRVIGTFWYATLTSQFLVYCHHLFDSTLFILTLLIVVINIYVHICIYLFLLNSRVGEQERSSSIEYHRLFQVFFNPIIKFKSRLRMASHGNKKNINRHIYEYISSSIYRLIYKVLLGLYLNNLYNIKLFNFTRLSMEGWEMEERGSETLENL